MDTKMRCPNCGKGVKVPAARIGRRGRCPHCQAAIVLQALPEQGELPVAQMIVEPQPSNEPLIAALHEHTAALREWTTQMGSMGATVARQLSEGLEEAQKRVAESQERQAEETRTLRAEGVREHQDLLEQIKSLQDSQVQRWGELARSFTEMVTLSQDQFALLRQGQLESAQDVVAAMARDLKTAQEQLVTGSQERAQAQADALERIVGRAGEAIAGINEQVAGLPGQLAAALEACSSNLHNQAESAASEAAQAFGKQTAALAERIITSLAQSQQAMTKPLATLGELVQKLAPFEQSLSRSWQTLTATDAFRRTLASIDQSLAQLNQALQSPAGPAAERLAAGVLEGTRNDLET